MRSRPRFWVAIVAGLALLAMGGACSSDAQVTSSDLPQDPVTASSIAAPGPTQSRPDYQSAPVMVEKPSDWLVSMLVPTLVLYDDQSRRLRVLFDGGPAGEYGLLPPEIHPSQSQVALSLVSVEPSTFHPIAVPYQFTWMLDADLGARDVTVNGERVAVQVE